MAQMNMQQMMKQARKMQEQLAAAQENIAQSTVDASAGGGMVKVTVNGEMQITSLKIDPEALDPEDVEMLEGHGRRERGAARRGRPREPPDGRHHRRPQHPRNAVLSSLDSEINGCFWTCRVARTGISVLPAKSFAKDAPLLGALRNNR